MVDIFIDPNEVSPLANHSPQANAPAKNEKGKGEFDKILSDMVKQQPTPFLTPDDLKEPVISKSTSAQQHSVSTPSTKNTDNTSPIEIKNHITPKEDLSQSEIQETKNKPQANSLRELMSRNPHMDEPAPQEKVQTSQPKPEAPKPAETKSENPDPVKESQQTFTSTNSSEPSSTKYIVMRGDTLSELVADFLKSNGIHYTTDQLYQKVRDVAAANGLSNPDLIFAGSRIDLSAALENTPANQSEEVFVWTDRIQPPTQGRITSEFGMRDHPILEGERLHTGVDIAVPVGTPIKTLNPGKVTYAGYKGGYGLMVEMEHGNGMSSRYAHLSELLVKPGDEVASSQDIALSGQTGNSTGPHLHLEIRRVGNPVDPLSLVARETLEEGYTPEIRTIAHAE